MRPKPEPLTCSVMPAPPEPRPEATEEEIGALANEAAGILCKLDAALYSRWPGNKPLEPGTFSEVAAAVTACARVVETAFLTCTP